MGVVGCPLGHLCVSSRAPWGHLGSACGALAVLKIIEKPWVFIIIPPMGDPWATFERLRFVLWGRWVLFGGHWALLKSPQTLLGGPLGILEGFGDRFWDPWGSLGGPLGSFGCLLGGPWASLEALGASWDRPGGPLGSFWRSGAILGSVLGG